MFFYLPETKGIPLAEMAKIFGDEVAVYAEDLHIDHRTHELIVEEHGVGGAGEIHRIATEAGVPGRRPSVEEDLEKTAIGHESRVEHLDNAQPEKH